MFSHLYALSTRGKFIYNSIHRKLEWVIADSEYGFVIDFALPTLHPTPKIP